MQAQSSTPDSGSFTYVDKPKTNMRVTTLLVWGVSCFLLYKAFTVPPVNPWIFWLVIGFFGLCCSLLVRDRKSVV